MKVTVDDSCIGCEVCVNMCPDVFQMGEDNLAHPTMEAVPEDKADDAKAAAEACPVEAIHVEE